MEHQKTQTESGTQTSVASAGSVSPASNKTFVLPAPRPAPAFDSSTFDLSMFKRETPKAVINGPGESEVPKIPTDIGQPTAPVVTAIDLSTVNNAAFMEAIIGNVPKGTSALVCSKAGDPTVGGWIPKPAAQVYGCAANTNTYFNCSIFKPYGIDDWKAQKEYAVSYRCLVLDDVGTKVARDGLGGFKPSWVIETSPGNFQVGFNLTNPLTSPEEVTRLQNAVIAAGLCDPGATGMARWVRLPKGINGKSKYKDAYGKPFHCRLTEWNPEVRYTVAELVAGLKLNMAATTELKAEQPAVVPKAVATTNAKKYAPIELSKIAQLLDAICPDCSRKKWMDAMMVVHYETGGSDAGFDLINAWSSKGTKYKGRRDVEVQWRSLDGYTGTPLTIGTLISMAREAGADVAAILQGDDDQFEPCETEVILPGATVTATISTVPNPQIANPLTRYSLRDSLAELEKQRVEQRLFLGELALLGQAMVIYALANTGKTVIVIHLILEALRKKLIDPHKLFYINMDDNSSGLVEKVRLFAEYGANMLADGHKGFSAKQFSAAMQKMIETNTASGTVVFLDTLKKFVNTMNKDESRAFAGVVRRFCLKGGTVIALSHANKNPGPDGKIKYTGTTDIVDDFDCAYTLQTVPQEDPTQRVVEFTNFKRRGDVALTAAYSYAVGRGVSYSELLSSVREVNPDQLEPIKQAAELQSDALVIAAIESSIGDGINSKMKLADAAAERTKVSKRSAMQVLEKYTGEDPNKHRWKFVVRDRGAKVFELLERPAEPTAATPDDLAL